MMRYLAFVLALIAPGPALALSCMAPTIERSYAHYDASDAVYVVVHGQLQFNSAKLPRRTATVKHPPEMTKISASFVGVSLGTAGLTLPFEQDVTLEVGCISRWCGSVRPGQDILAFVRKDVNGYALEIGPCPSAVFDQPKSEMLTRVEECLSRQNCKSE